MGQRKVSGESGPPSGRTGSRQQQHQHQPSIDSMNGPISEEQEPQSSNPTKLAPKPETSREERPSLDVRDHSDQPSVEGSSPEPPIVDVAQVAERAPDSEEVEKLKSMNDWYASELALARRAGYTPQTNNSAIFDRRRESLADDERPIVEAMLVLKGELTKVQAQLDTQSTHAAQKMQEIERQRDVAIQEAVYAKAKLAALGGPSTPVPGEKGFDSTTMDAEKMTDMSRKLAASLSAQADLSAKCLALTAEVAAERKARHLADEMASTAQRRISELDEFRNRAASEIENLRAELLDAGKAYRDEAALGQEAAADVKLLRIDQAELTSRLEEVMAENKSYQASLEQLSKAMQVNNAKGAMLERQLEEDRQVKESLERKLAQLRSESEEKTADLQNANQRLKDVEELMETYAEEAKVANACLAAGLDKMAAREPPSMLASATEERVRVLQEQVINTQALLAKSQAQADETGEKLAEAMQRVAGLEFQQGQSSKDSIALRRRMAEVSDEARRLKQENVDLVNQLDRKQLEVDAVTAKHNALKEILQERGSLSALDKRRSRNLQNSSPESGTATPEQLNRLRELEARLEESLRAHRETKNTAEMQAQEVEKHFREKLEQLENDYQSAVHYVKGTEKMLKRMKEELTKYKAQNEKLRQELEESQSKPRSTDSEADWEQERDLLNHEIDELRIKVRESAMALDKQIRETNARLDAQRDQFASTLEKLESENQTLAHRAESAEQKVSMLLDQVENSVDAYRRSMHVGQQNGGVPESARSSYYSGPDNRTSVALDSLASELDALRNHWESTNKTYRISNTFDFEKTPTPTTPQQSDFSSNITQWRQKLAAEEEEEELDDEMEGGGTIKGRFKPSAATVAAGGGVI
jgi:DNA repair exonuclease SbcCD ATPase subunit